MARRLTLCKETLAALTQAELAGVAGADAVPTYQSCPVLCLFTAPSLSPLTTCEAGR